MNLDFRLSESEEILKTATLNFLKRDINKQTLEGLHDSDTGTNEAIWRKVVEMGWLGIITPEEFGGTGYPLTTAGILFEALGSAPLPGPYFSSAILGSLIIQEAGTADQKKSLLPALVEGTMVPTLILTDPWLGWNSEAAQISCQEKDGNYLLSGRKLLAYDALAATHLIVPVPLGKKRDSLSLFLVDKKMEGVSLRKLPGYLMGRAFEVCLEAVSCPSSGLLSKFKRGGAPLRKAVQKSIPILCSYLVGGCQAVFDLTVAYSRIRVQFSQPIGRFQRVQDMIIDMINQVDAARWTTYEALWKLDTQGTAPESIHLAKAVAGEAYWQCCNLAHRAISGISYSMEHPLSLHTRTSRAWYNFLGEPAYHKQQLAGLLLMVSK
ncbi:MAG: acyl-CoA dehydrogenase family protein [Thermodesulfobacteriota bacterium]